MELYQVIIVEPDKIQLDQFQVTLSTINAIEVIGTETLADAVSFLQILPDVKLIIINYSQGADEDSERALLKYINKQKSISKILVAGKNLTLNIPSAKFIGEKIIAAELLELVSLILNLGNVVVVEDNTSYEAVKIDYLLYFTTAPVEIFVQIGQENKYNYIRRFSVDAPVEPTFLNRYKINGREYLHLKSEDKPLFKEKMIDYFLGRLHDVEKLHVSEVEEACKIQQVVIEHLIKNRDKKEHNEMGFIDFYPEEFKLVRETISSVLKSIKKSNSLIGTLIKIYQTSEVYSYRHNYMTSVVCYNILKEFPWATNVQHEALIYTSFFHDIILEGDELVLIDDEKFLGNEDWSASKKDKVMKHALLASQYVISKKNYPAEADIVIKQHHGSETGIGFPTQISDKIHNLALIFLIAESFVIQVITSDNKNIDVLKVIKSISSKYTGASIAPVIDALKKALIASDGK